MFVAACAVVALVAACVVGDPQGSLSGDDDGYDDTAIADVSCVLPACRAEPVLTLDLSGTVFVDQLAPPARRATLEIFRPPRARA